jgi:hypothetical protein
VMRSLRCAAAASQPPPSSPSTTTDTDLSWAWRAAGSASSRESLPKLERLQRWCRVYIHKVYRIGSTIAAGGRVRARRHHAACCRWIDRRGGCKGRKSEQQASKPSRCCAASLYFEPAAEGRQCRNRILRLLCRLALCSPKNTQMALSRGMVLRMARCGTKRQDGEEGRAEAVMRNVSKQCVSACRTAEAILP